MIPENLELNCDGRRLTEADFEDSWEVEFTAKELAQFEISKEIDATLCETMTIGKTHDGEFFAWWREYHPELGSWEDYFGDEDRSEERCAEWSELLKRMPASYYSTEIEREEAYTIIAWFWLPSEFHGEAGLSISDE
jgi:hypothetical protein